MKVNFILPGLGDSGGIKVVRKYVELMKQRDIDVCIYCSVIADNLHRYQFNFLNFVHQVYCTMKLIWVAVRNRNEGVKWVLSISDAYIRPADVTIATLWTSAYQVNNLSSKCGKKFYFIQGYEVWDDEKLGKESYLLPLEKIVVSGWINKQLADNLGIGPFPVVYNGLDTTVFKKHNSEKKDENQPKICLMLNHTMKVKGVPYGIKAFELVKERYPDCKLLMFGMCPRGDLPDYVEYTQDPTREELVSLYSNADIFIFPSIEEGWGLTPLEAMACKCAVVGSETGFVLDLGVHKKNMMISKPKDYESMANNIIELIENEDLLKNISEAGFELSRQLDWEKSLDVFLKLLKEE